MTKMTGAFHNLANMPERYATVTASQSSGNFCTPFSCQLDFNCPTYGVAAEIIVSKEWDH